MFLAGLGANESWGEGCRLEEIYYYTPVPLNLASNNNNKQATRLLSVLAFPPSRRIGLDPTLAIFCIGTWPYQIRVLTHQWQPGV